MTLQHLLNTVHKLIEFDKLDADTPIVIDYTPCESDDLTRLEYDEINKTIIITNRLMGEMG